MHFGKYAEMSSDRLRLSFVADDRAKYGADAQRSRAAATEELRRENAKLAEARDARKAALSRGPDVRFELTSGLIPEAVDREIRRGRRAGDVGHRVTAFYLADCADRGIYQSFGHASVISYAMKRHGISRRSARELIAVGRALRDLRKIDAAFMSDELSWSKVRAIAKVAVAETEDAWLAFALGHSLDEIERQSALAKKGEKPRDDRKGLAETKFNVSLRIGALLHEQYLLARQRLSADEGRDVTDEEFAGAILESYLRKGGEGRSADSLYRVVLDLRPSDGAATIRSDDGPVPIDPAMAQAIACDAGVLLPDGKPHDKYPPPVPDGLRLRILARDGHRCLVCRSRSELHVHHIVYRSRRGSNAWSNLMALCSKCHGLVHGGYLSIAGRAPRALDLRDRDGNPVNDLAKVSEADRNALLITPGGGAGAPSDSRNPAGKPVVREPRLPKSADIAWVRRRLGLLSWDKVRTGLQLGEGEPPAELPTPPEEPDEPASPNALRPVAFEEIVGQVRVVDSLRHVVEASKSTGRMPDHLLLLGATGLGKTTLACALAHELGARLNLIDCSTLDSPLTLLGRLMDVRDRDVLFFDEVQALPPRLCEALYQAMEDGTIQLPFVDGVRVTSVGLVLPKITVVAATTHPEKLPAALRGRFPRQEDLAPYSAAELEEIVMRAATRDGFGFTADAAATIAGSCAGLAREAIALYKRTRTLAEAARRTGATVEDARCALREAGIDARGFGPVQRRVLEILARHGRPLATRRLATLAGVSLEAYRTIYEPVLLVAKAIVPTPRGIALAPAGRRPLKA